MSVILQDLGLGERFCFYPGRVVYVYLCNGFCYADLPDTMRPVLRVETDQVVFRVEAV